MLERRRAIGAITAVLVVAGAWTMTSVGAQAASRTTPPTATAISTYNNRDGLAEFMGDDSSRSSAGPESRAITVTPNTDLVDGQSVNVSGTGFGGDSVVGLLQCAVGMGRDGCDLNGLVLLDGPGHTLDVSYRVRAILHLESGDVDCRTFPAGCRLFANDHFSLNGAALAATGFDPDGPLEPPPIVTASPNTDLVDGQVIDATGSGFHPDTPVLLLQCPAGTPDPLFDCVNFDVTDADANGDIAAPFHVAAILNSFIFEGGEGAPGFETVDCRVEACELYAASGDNFDHSTTTPLEFDPDGPLVPVRQLTVTPHADLVDGQVVDVDISGYTADGPAVVIECSPSSDVNGNGCDFDARQQFTTDANGAAHTTFPVKAAFATNDGPLDCRIDSCILVVADLAVPLAIGEGYEFQELSFLPGSATPADPTPVAPQFTG